MTHNCISQRIGDVIIWTCPRCANYRRVLNWRTGKMLTVPPASHIMHEGVWTKDKDTN